MLLIALACSSAARAAVPEGPRLAYVSLAERPLRLELNSVDQSGDRSVHIAGGAQKTRPLPLPGVPSWSPDGEEIAFAGLSARSPQAKGGQRIYIAAADGSALTAVPGTVNGSKPVFAPDGQTLAFQRERKRVSRGRGARGESLVEDSSTIWLVEPSGGALRRLTPWRKGLTYTPDSFSPDGSELIATRQPGPRSPPELVAISLSGGQVRVLAHESADGIFSPDGSQIAYLLVFERSVKHGSHGGRAALSLEETTDLYTMNANGSDPRQVTDTPAVVEDSPSWDPSGQRLLVTELRPGGGGASLLGFGNAIVQMNLDGSCEMKVLSTPGVALYGGDWQPGPGRSAGPINC